MQTAYLVVIVHQNGSVWVDSVHGTLQGAVSTMETCREQNRSTEEGLQFDFVHIVERPLYL